MDELGKLLLGVALTVIGSLLGFIGIGYGGRIGSLEETRRTHGERLAALEASLDENKNSLDRIERSLNRLLAWHLRGGGIGADE